MSNSPTDQWMQFYQQNHNGLSGGGEPNVFGGERITDATVVTTTSSTSAATGGNNQNQMTMSMSPESGRVTKPARKRSRASRRTPTTLLNTDKSNFRAMVQQFTGGPAFGSGSASGNPNFMAAAAFGLGLTGGTRGQAPPGGGAMQMMGPGAGGYQLQYQQQQGLYQQNRNSYSDMMYSGQCQDPSNPGGLIQRLMIGNSNSAGMGMGMEGQGHGEAAAARPSAGGTNENTSYMF